MGGLGCAWSAHADEAVQRILDGTGCPPSAVAEDGLLGLCAAVAVLGNGLLRSDRNLLAAADPLVESFWDGNAAQVQSALGPECREWAPGNGALRCAPRRWGTREPIVEL
jgi:hypothetical protein